jgi:hypothetical protein
MVAQIHHLHARMASGHENAVKADVLSTPVLESLERLLTICRQRDELRIALAGLIQECEYSASSGLPFNFPDGKGRWTQLERAKALLLSNGCDPRKCDELKQPASTACSAVDIARFHITRLEEVLKPALELANLAHHSAMSASEEIGNQNGTGAGHACLALPRVPRSIVGLSERMH